MAGTGRSRTQNRPPDAGQGGDGQAATSLLGVTGHDVARLADTFSENIFDTRCVRAYFLGAASVTIFTNFFGALTSVRFTTRSR